MEILNIFEQPVGLEPAFMAMAGGLLDSGDKGDIRPRPRPRPIPPQPPIPPKPR